MKKPKILAVDDKPANLIALEAVLDRDYDVVRAGSGDEALRIVAAGGADVAVILMDVQMPIMDGFECARRIKALPHMNDVPIVFITAVYQEDPFIKRGFEVGGVDYFGKPFDPDLLRLKIGIYASFRQKAELLRERELHIRESEELLEAGRKLSAFLESLPIGVLVADVDGRICQSNDAVARICKSSELVAHDAYGQLLGWWDDGGRLIKDKAGPLAHALHGESSHGVHLEIRALDGAPITLLCSASPLLGRDSNVVGAVIILQDMTEPKRIERDLENRVARLVSAGLDLERGVHA